MSSTGKVHFLRGTHASPKYNPSFTFSDAPKEVTCEQCIRGLGWRNAYIAELRKEQAGE